MLYLPAQWNPHEIDVPPTSDMERYIALWCKPLPPPVAIQPEVVFVSDNVVIDGLRS